MEEPIYMLPADVDPERLDFTDPDVVGAIEVLHKEQKYNSYLMEFLQNAYSWQKEAMNLSKDNRVIGLICGNQCGKTETSMAVVAMHLTGLYPSYYTGRRFAKAPLICIAGENANHNRMSLQKKLFGTDNRQLKNEMGSGMIPLDLIIEDSVAGDRGTSVKTCKVKHTSGEYSSLEFRAYSDGREAIQGFSADMIVIDEQPPEDFWSEALVRTTATSGLVMCSFTPLKGFDGLVSTLWNLPEDTESLPLRVKKDKPWAMVNAGWMDCPHISQEQIDNLAVGLNDSQLQARKYGTPYLGEGRVFPVEVSKTTYENMDLSVRKDWKHLISVDFGFTRDPMALLFSAWDEENDVIYIIKEWKGNVNTVEELASQIWALHRDTPVAWPRDGNATMGGFKGGDTVAGKLMDLNVNLLPKAFTNPRGLDGKKNNHIEPGIVEINSRIMEGRLKINEKCKELLSEMDKYAYEKGKIKPKQEDHLIDSLRYNVMTQIQEFGEPLDGNAWLESWSVDNDEEYSVI